ncbi:AAA family ATPase [Dongia soli]|uniref:AAA family ATPase n=1 Tax=Dongia soli TaxID=600628 RepID=A0ABU5EER6_9PROT|nr:AAA family ATPase [Dongia soli]MDY0884878.1 AAA family ATPase [Dongia soli]
MAETKHRRNETKQSETQHGEVQREIIDFLSTGKAYGDDTAEIRRIETHCSVIFLTKDRAFKLKQAVKFSYLDYTDIADREKFTRAELSLNRRTAPEIYLAIHKVLRGGDGSLQLAAENAEGDALDWVLEMRRFGDDSLLASLADANRLTPVLMLDLADAIHRFHDKAERMPQHGNAHVIAHVLDDCVDNLQQHVPPLDRSGAEEVALQLRAKFGAVSPLIEQRREAGMVRRCHGDLHLGNICLLDGRPTLFDCIEFSDDISCIDVFYDLAFVLMDLCHRDDRHRALANVLLNRYLDRSGDITGLAALPFFLSLRAAIRSHILAGGSKNQSDPAIGDKKRKEAIAYLDTARGLLRPGTPRLIAVAGLSGSGKSSLARELAPAFLPAPGARVIRSDTLRKRLQNVPPEMRLDPPAYSQQASDRVYEAMLQEAATALDAGYTVILDATYLRQRERLAAEELARNLNLRFDGFWLDVSREKLTARLDARRHDASDADRTVLAQQLTYDLGDVTWHRIDAGGALESSLHLVRLQL